MFKYAKQTLGLGLVLLAAAVSASAGAAEPAAGDKPLSAILQTVEKHGTVTRAEREWRYWEVLVCESRTRCTEFYLDPVSGREIERSREGSLARLPPGNAKPLSAVVASLEKRELGTIGEAEFDDGRWEIDVRTAQGRNIELYVDPLTAEITRCEGRGCPTR